MSVAISTGLHLLWYMKWILIPVVIVLVLYGIHEKRFEDYLESEEKRIEQDSRS